MVDLSLNMNGLLVMYVKDVEGKQIGSIKQNQIKPKHQHFLFFLNFLFWKAFFNYYLGGCFRVFSAVMFLDAFAFQVFIMLVTHSLTHWNLPS